MQVKMFI